MVSVRRKKYALGEGAKYMTRKEALRYLQLSLKTFRRLCILKGIYPREPKNRKKAQKGKTSVKTLYARKDIRFLSHEPLIWEIRQLKSLSKKMARAFSLREFEELKRLKSLHPKMALDHIIKERYPTFADAVRDLDDCLSICYLFSTFPTLQHVPRELQGLCRRLTVEFMHACITSRALRKIFVSIKGYYYQVEIMGHLITWLAPHNFPFQPLTKDEVDFRIMGTFAEFYTILLGFVNFQLYQSLGLIYPPKIPKIQLKEEASLADHKQYMTERIAALNTAIVSTGVTVVEETPLDEFPGEEGLEREKQEVVAAQRQKTLFAGLKVFLSRETPREPLVFCLRSFGAQMSWDSTLFVGATFAETDETITHQIVDRPTVSQQYLSRYYVQPQWVFDCVNARELLPCDKYLLGAILPPHLSPFVSGDRARVYQPPEETPDIPLFVPPPTEPEKKEEPNTEEAEMEVKRGAPVEEDPRASSKLARQERELRERMVSKKFRRLHRSMAQQRKRESKEIWLLRKKRRIIEQNKKEG